MNKGDICAHLMTNSIVRMASLIAMLPVDKQQGALDLMNKHVNEMVGELNAANVKEEKPDVA